MEVYTTTFIGDNGNMKDIKLENIANIYKEKIRFDRNKTLLKVNVTLNDMQIRVQYRVGDPVKRNISCNSEYMTGAMTRAGKAFATSVSLSKDLSQYFLLASFLVMNKFNSLLVLCVPKVCVLPVYISPSDQTPLDTASPLTCILLN